MQNSLHIHIYARLMSAGCRCRFYIEGEPGLIPVERRFWGFIISSVFHSLWWGWSCNLWQAPWSFWLCASLAHGIVHYYRLLWDQQTQHRPFFTKSSPQCPSPAKWLDMRLIYYVGTSLLPSEKLIDGGFDTARISSSVPVPRGEADCALWIMEQH